MNILYDIGVLVVVRDPYTHEDVICVIVGLATVNIHEDRDGILYRGFSFKHGKPYYFFDSDIICLAEDYD